MFIMCFRLAHFYGDMYVSFLYVVSGITSSKTQAANRSVSVNYRTIRRHIRKW
jgi:hypothetical protein